QLLQLRQIQSFDLRPGDAAAGHGGLQPLPEVAVEDRLAFLGLPAAPLPAVEPAGGSVAQVVRAGMDGHGGAARQPLEGGDRSQEVELVGSGGPEAAGEHGLAAALADQRGPASFPAGAGDPQEDLGFGSSGGGSAAPPLADLLRRQLVGPLVPAIAGVSSHPVPVDLVTLDQLGEPAPEILVLQLSCLSTPAAGDPAGKPLGDPFPQILGVGEEV